MPKKKGKKKKGGAKKSEDGDAPSAEKQLILLNAEKVALTRELGHYKQVAHEAVQKKRELEAQCSDLKNELSEHSDNQVHISMDMTRQYKSMQEELMGKVNDAHSTITVMKGELESARNGMELQKHDFQKVIDEKDQKIRNMKKRMEDMANEFSEMLKETLKKMRQRIDITGVNWEADKTANVISKLEQEDVTE